MKPRGGPAKSIRDIGNDVGSFGDYRDPSRTACIDRLADGQGRSLIVMDIHEPSSYGVAIFLLFEQGQPDFSVLGYLYLDQWDEAFRGAPGAHGVAD